MKTAIVLGMMIALAGDPAWAQSPRPAGDATTSPRQQGKPWNRGTTLEVRVDAEAIFMEGNRLFRVPLFAQAAVKYRAALATWKHPAIHYNLALALLNTGQDVEARENLERALAYGEEPLGAAEFQEGQRQLAELERQLGRIKITCQTPGAEVTLDGVTLFTAPGSHRVWVMPKSHEITARKKEYLSESRQVVVAPAGRDEIDLKLITLADAADANRRWATWKPWTVVAVGGAIAAGGGVFHRLSSQNADTYDAELLRLGCANDQVKPGCEVGQVPPELNDRLARAQRQRDIAVGSYVVGGAVIAAGFVMLYLNRPHLDEQRAPTSPGRRVAVVPAVSADMLGVFVRIGP